MVTLKEFWPALGVTGMTTAAGGTIVTTGRTTAAVLINGDDTVGGLASVHSSDGDSGFARTDSGGVQPLRFAHGQGRAGLVQRPLHQKNIFFHARHMVGSDSCSTPASSSI